jgi:hypothetical protein
MPLTIIIRSILLDLEEYRDLTVVKRTHRIRRYKCAESLKLVFMHTFKDKSGVLCIYGTQILLQRDEVNNVVNIPYFMVKRAGAKTRKSGGNQVRHP